MIASGDYWTLDDNGLLSIFCVGDMPDYEWPDYAPWYSSQHFITSVSISNSVTAIGDCAFYDCYYLTSVTIPDSVTSIGYDAFSGCFRLESLILSDSVTIIGSYAFYGVGGGDVDNVYYTGTEEQWNEIDIEYGNENLTSGEIHYNYAPPPPPPVPIAPGAFTVAVSYTHDGQTFTTSFQLNMVAEYYDITPPTKTTYQLGDTLNYSGLSVVRHSSDGTSADITSNCTLSPVAGTTVTEAGSITVSVSYEGVTRGTFQVTALESGVIADGGWWTLFDTGLLDVRCSGDMPDYEDIYDYSRYDDYVGKYYWMWYPMTSAPWDYYNHRPMDYEYSGYSPFISGVSIQSGVTAIGNWAFSGCSLGSVVIPDGVTRIGDYAFYDSGVTSVVIPASVTEIGEYAFAWNDYLRSVTISRDCTVGYNAFDEDCEINYY